MVSADEARHEAETALTGAARMGRRIWVAAAHGVSAPVQRFLADLATAPVLALPLDAPSSLARLGQEGDVLVLPQGEDAPAAWQAVAQARKLRSIILEPQGEAGPFDISLPASAAELGALGACFTAAAPQPQKQKFFADWPSLCAATAGLRPLVFTNGVFDILHRGHIHSLQAARDEGAYLVVGVNSDASVRRLGKGTDRPIQCEDDRAALLAALSCVDFVTIFTEDTPARLIETLKPDVLVKGGDYRPDQIAGADFVKSRGGRIVTITFEHDRSTTQILRRIRAHD